MNNEWVIAIVFFVLGLIPAYYFYKISIKTKEPVYSIKSNNLISGSTSTLENLNITYKDHKVKNLTVSKILFYNRGAETITDQDLETIKHLSIASAECSILDGSILQVNNISNNFRVRYNKDNENVVIDFDYLDKNQGAVIQVVHTGLSSDDLVLSGDIKGVEKLTQVDPKQLIKTTPTTAQETGFYTVTTLITLLGFYLIRYHRDLLNSLQNSDNGLIVLFSVAMTLGFGLSAIATVLILPVIIYSSVFPSANTIPIGLENFDE